MIRVVLLSVFLVFFGNFANADVEVDEYIATLKIGTIVEAEEVAPLTMEDYMLEPSVRVVKGNHTGSGVAFKTDGVSGTRILTAYHVVAGGDIGGITVQFYGSPEIAYTAYIVSYDEAQDIAVLIIEEPIEHVAILGTMNDFDVFSEVWCVGSPMGIPTSVTKGIVSNKGLKRPDNGNEYVQVDCGIYSGNSGGPAFAKNEAGQYVVIGLNDWVLTGPVIGAPFGGRTVVPHLGFAVRIDNVRRHLQQFGMNPK